MPSLACSVSPGTLQTQLQPKSFVRQVCLVLHRSVVLQLKLLDELIHAFHEYLHYW